MTLDQKSCSDRQKSCGVNLSSKLAYLLGNIVFPEQLEGFGIVRNMESIEMTVGSFYPSILQEGFRFVF